MKKQKIIPRLLAIMLIGLFIFSCSKDELTNDPLYNKITETNVSLNLAKKVALNFTKDEAFIGKPNKVNLKISLRSSKNVKSIPFPGFEEREVDTVLELKGNSGKTSLFVIKFSPNGYIIVPSTKKEVPILAFSNNGFFNEYNISNGIQDWINDRVSIVTMLEEDEETQVSEDVEEQWDCFAPPVDQEEIVSGGTIYEQVGPLLETRWGQGRGYNEYVKYNNCTAGNAPTGCVATAMAQIIKYHEYPNSYNWSIMLDQIKWNTPINSSTNEIAKLMEDVGNAVDMNWECTESGAYTSKARNALVNTFGYSSYASYTNFNKNVVVQQLGIYNQPVLLRGQDPSVGGHAWVCDGYKRIKYTSIHNPETYYEYETYTFSQIYLHMNWGWNGNSNNWYYHGTPQVAGANFSTGYKMIINIHP